MLRRLTDETMRQATDFGNQDNRAQLFRFDWPSVGCILVEREVRARLVKVKDGI